MSVQLDFSNVTTLWTCLIYRPGEKHHFIREDLKYPYNSSLERRKTDTCISFNDDLCKVNGDEIVFEPGVVFRLFLVTMGLLDEISSNDLEEVCRKLDESNGDPAFLEQVVKIPIYC